MRSVTQRRISAGGETPFGAVIALNSITFWGPQSHMGHPGSLVTLCFGSKKPSLPLRCSYACSLTQYRLCVFNPDDEAPATALAGAQWQHPGVL